MNYKKVIALILILVAPAIYGQAVPWTVTPTSVSQTIRLAKVDSTVSYNSTFNTLGDAIGVFYDQGGTWVCAGYLQLDGVTDVFTVYGNDAVDNGFQLLENFHFMYWRKDQNCIIDNVTGGMSNNQYTTGQEDILDLLGALPASVSYPKPWYCKYDFGALTVQLVITGTTFSNLVLTYPPDLYVVIDPFNGGIEDFNGLKPGTYEIDVSTLDNMCLADTTFSVTVHYNLLSSPTITTKDESCTALGAIQMDTATIVFGNRPLAFGLGDANSMNVVSSPKGEFSNLPAGAYNMIIKDNLGCGDTIPVSIQPNVIPCEEEITPEESNSIIISPNLTNDHNKAKFDWEGETKIYNAQGELIKILTAPTLWDGTNKNGAVVNTGTYFIFYQEKKKLEVTVIY